jgi:hypothetical protein
MYRLIYKEMIGARVARKLPKSMWLDRKGKIVECEEKAFGLLMDNQMPHPDYIIFLDETGSNTNM